MPLLAVLLQETINLLLFSSGLANSNYARTYPFLLILNSRRFSEKRISLKSINIFVTKFHERKYFNENLSFSTK